jgi:membrane-bound ClpP family serine protease
METLAATIVQHLPALILLILGFVLVLVEMHIPGFGVPGILGILSLVAGIMLFANSAVEALVITILIVALLCIALSLVIRSATKGRLARSKLVLREVSVPTLGEKDLSFFVGKTGHARTPLRPAGIAEFDGVRLNVVSDGE